MQAFNRPVAGTSQVDGNVKEYSRENMDVLNDSKILGEHIDDEMVCLLMFPLCPLFIV